MPEEVYTMAKVVVKVLGGEEKVIEASTVGEARQKVGASNYDASLNGEPVADGEQLYDREDGMDFLSFTAKVKAA